MRSKLWFADDLSEEYFGERQTITVEEETPAMEESGLLDAEGNPLVRHKQRIGFI